MERLKMEYPSADEGKRLKKSPDGGNFGFGFNDVVFSDRVLRLEIMPALASDMDSGGEKYLNWFSSLEADHSECGSDLKVKTLHISSLVLAAKSQFFYKLFKNGMRESQQRDDVTLRINESEEAALMDVLNFMYGNPLSATSTSDLVDVLMAADKFEVVSCMQCCIDLLLKLPMSLESALLCLELPSTVMVAEVVQPLIDAAKKYLASCFWELTKSQLDVAMTLPLCILEAVLSSDGLQVDSEDDVFEFVLNWAIINYPKLEERREVLTKCLAPFICFAYMSSSKLKEVIDCPDLEYEQVSKLILNALIAKDQVLPTAKCGFPRRVYKYRLIKLVQLECVHPCCVVYFELKKEECKDLFPSKQLYSQEFCLGGRDLILIAECRKRQRNSLYYFGFFMTMRGSETCELDYEFAVMKKPSKEFQIVSTINKCTFTDEDRVTVEWLFEWSNLMSDDSVYFIDGILHLRVQIATNN